MADQFISVREAAQVLGTSEKKIMDLVEDGNLQAYRIAGQFLRLKKNEVADIKKDGSIQEENTRYQYTTKERVADFVYFNDFYIISLFVIAYLLYLIFFIS